MISCIPFWLLLFRLYVLGRVHCFGFHVIGWFINSQALSKQWSIYLEHFSGSSLIIYDLLYTVEKEILLYWFMNLSVTQLLQGSRWHSSLTAHSVLYNAIFRCIISASFPDFKSYWLPTAMNQTCNFFQFYTFTNLCLHIF